MLKVTCTQYKVIDENPRDIYFYKNNFVVNLHVLLFNCRMSQELMIELIDMLEPRLERASPLAIPHWMEVLIAIRFFAEGGYQKGVGRDYNHPSHQTTVSVTLNRVIEAILTYRGEIIRFPATPAERDEVEAKFVSKNIFLF